MKIKLAKLLKVSNIALILFLFCIAVVIWSVYNFSVDDMRVDYSYVVDVDKRYELYIDENYSSEINLPYEFKTVKGQEISIIKNIPRAYWGQTIAVYTKDMNIKVYFENELTYRFGVKDRRLFSRNPGSLWHFIDIPKDMNIGKMKMVFISPYNNQSARINYLMIGTRDSCIWKVFKANILKVLICFALFIIIVMFLIVSIWIKKARIKSIGLGNLCIFFFLMFLNSFIETNIPQFFYGNQSVYLIIYYMSLILAPIFLLLFFGKRFLNKGIKKKNYLYNIALYIQILAILTCLFMQITNLMDFVEISVIINSAFYGTCIYIFIICALIIKNKIENYFEFLAIFIGYTIFFILSCTDTFINYYSYSIDKMTYTRIGVLTFAVFSACVVIYNIGNVFNLSIKKQAEMYKKEKEIIIRENQLLQTANEATEEANRILNNYKHDLEKSVEEKTYKILSMQQQVIEGFANLIENRDTLTGQHVKRTSTYVGIISDIIIEKKLFEDEINIEKAEILSKAAPLHDIGKIVIPDSILCKPGKLTDDEFEIIKKHTNAGCDIIEQCLRGIESELYMDVAKEMAKCHHEKWNGTGYPLGLKEKEIPLSARIMAVADVFDALISKRIYKEPMSYEEAFNIIEKSKGTHFDPYIVDIFLGIKEKIIDVTDKMGIL